MEHDELKIAKKLADISLVMADGFMFMKVRSLVEEWDRMAKDGDPTAKQAMQTINQFYNLCKYVLGDKNV